MDNCGNCPFGNLPDFNSELPSLEGKNCSMPCPENRYGRLCSQNCTCQSENTRQCNHENGFCICKEQFYGLNCEHFCEPQKNNLICPNNSTHSCSCELTLEQKYIHLEQRCNQLDKEMEEVREILTDWIGKTINLRLDVGTTKNASEKRARMKTILFRLDEIDREIKTLENEQGSHPLAILSIVLLLVCLFSYLVYRTVTSFGLLRGVNSKLDVRYSRRSRENGTFDNPIYTTNDALLTDEASRAFAKENEKCANGHGSKAFRNPFRSSKFLDKLSKFNLTENPFRQRSQLVQATDDDTKRRSTEENELKDTEIYTTISIANEQRTESEETIRMP